MYWPGILRQPLRNSHKQKGCLCGFRGGQLVCAILEGDERKMVSGCVRRPVWEEEKQVVSSRVSKNFPSSE